MLPGLEVWIGMLVIQNFEKNKVSGNLIWNTE